MTKAAAAEWTEADARINRWLGNPKGNAIRTGSKTTVGPPKKGELGDADREEIASKAMERWSVERKAAPETYAARALGGFRSKAKSRQGNHSGADVPAEQPSAEEKLVAGETAIEDLQKVAPVQVIAEFSPLTVNNWRSTLPSELTLEAIEDGLGRLAGDALLAARRHSSARLDAIAAVLTALSDGNTVVDGALDRVARKHLGPRRRGPESRAVQANEFIRAVRGGSPWSILNRLRSSPAIAKDTHVPTHGPGWPAEDEAAALNAIFGIVKNDVLSRAGRATPHPIEAAEAANLAKVILRALGAPASAVKNLAAHRAKAKSRAKAKTRG